MLHSSTFSKLTSSFLHQVDLPRHLLARGAHQVDRQGLHPQQVHVPAESVELARLHRGRPRLRHALRQPGQPGRPADVPGAQGAQDRLHHAR